MSSDFESRVRETGLRLYQLIEGETPSIFKKEFWTGKVMEWSMKNEDFKVRLFRFIDVFPYLIRPESVAKHLVEYLSGAEHNIPAAFQFGLKHIDPTSMAGKRLAKSIANNIKRMGKQFIAGAMPREALSVLEHIRSQGMAFTADLLGEAAVSEKEAEEYVTRYLELFDILNEAQNRWQPLGGDGNKLDWGSTPMINVSIKPSSMYSQMNARAFEYSLSRAKEHLRPIFRKAVEIGAHVCLDLEHTGLKNLTLALYRSLLEEPEFTGYPHTAIVIQTYLRDTEHDLHDLVEWVRKKKQRITIRLVKGAYWDAEVIWAGQKNWPVPVFTHKPETDANFEKLARYLMGSHEWVYLACASQSIRSIACVMELAKELKVPDGHLEYQILYGMAEPVRNALRKAGLPLRLYAPIGEMLPGMAYLVRRLLENTSNESFLRQSFVEGVSPEILLKNPVEYLKEKPSSPTPGLSTKEGGSIGSFQNEPLWDWTLSQHREQFSAILGEMREKNPYKVPLFIAGETINTTRESHSRNPNRPEEIVGFVASAGTQEAERAISAAVAAFPVWRDTDPRSRAQLLFQAAAVARSMRYELAALQVYEVGKNWSEADADVCEAIDFFEYYGREMIRLATPQRMGKVPGEVSHLFYEPRGVAAVIAPWNFPLAISAGMTSAALVTGNTVVYKPSSKSAVTGYMLYKIFEQTKLPHGVLNFLPGPGEEIGNFLVTHPDVALIAFTGSKEIGLRIIDLAGKTPEGAMQVKKVVAEMGGKNAIIIDADADLDEAVVHIIQSAFGYQGQKCSACSRLIVLEENYDRLIERLKAAAESIELGPPEDPKNFMGAVIDAAAREKILHFIEAGNKEGTLVFRREVPNSKGYCVPLTIFTEVRPEHQIAQEEIFGPVLAIIKVRDFAEALEVANSTQYALTGSVFSRSPENIAQAKREFRVGNLYINRGCTGAIVGRHPFGGFQMSGVGSQAGGPDYLHQFMVPRNIVENTLRRGFIPIEE